MKLNNDWMKLSIRSDSKLFDVVRVLHNVEEVNEYCRKNSGCGLIAIDSDGNYYIAKHEPEEK